MVENKEEVTKITPKNDNSEKKKKKKKKKKKQSYKDMMEHIERFNDHNINFLVFGRKVNNKFISLDKIKVPEIIKSRCTGFEEASFRDDISSTELRLIKD